MADQSALKRVFAEYARTIARPYDVGEVLYRLTDDVTEVLGIDGSGVSIADLDGHLRFVTATDEQVSRVEHLQIKSQEGPCHDAFRSGDQVTCADLSVEERWPSYTPRTLELGMRSACGIPMAAGDTAIGALNLYHREPREWPADDMADAQLLADMATGYIINALTLREREELADNLSHALQSRVVIEQAKGVIAERHQIDPDSAFQRLRAHARSSRVKIHDAARAVVAGDLDLQGP